MKNIISWFQIPVTNFERAVKFYNTILSVELLESQAMGAKVALFPHDMKNGAVGGALYEGVGFTPSDEGTAILLNAGEDLSVVLLRIEQVGGRITMPKTPINNNNGFIAYFIDSEGNRIGLHSKN